MDKAQIFRIRSRGLSWREVGEELIVLDQRSSVYLRINPSGAAIWGQLQQGATLDQLVEALMETFALPEARARADAQAFLDVCAARGLMEASGAEA